MSSTTEPSPNPPHDLPKNNVDDDDLAASLEKLTLLSAENSLEVPSGFAGASDENSTLRPLIVYTRKELIHLSTSPLVKVPDRMPAFKAWFGELEPAPPPGKKESEQANGNGADRTRRYRRDAEDGDASARPSFRSAMSQPSQMGNFKHQPLRGGDRDRERETERSLRNLSEKYDREKGRADHLGLPTNSTLLRNRDRESAPHLASARSTGRKREGESGDDWRRAPDSSRTTRDDHNSRRDRDDRDRPRSRARDSSRNRISPPSRRDDKDREKRGERDRADDTFSRRDRDRDRFPDAEDDPWRDGGKKDDRRRERYRLDREGGKSQDADKDHTSRDRELRDTWGPADDKDGRGQKRGGRERRQGDIPREKEDRRDRDKEEPAWMETYVPSPSNSTGILGKTADGEVDSIQAWKKDMKAREQRAKGLPADSSSTSQGSSEDPGIQPAPPPPPPATVPLGVLDEIQQFKIMMKKEEEKRTASSTSTSTHEPLPTSKSPTQTLDTNYGLDRGRNVSNSTTAASVRSETPAYQAHAAQTEVSKSTSAAPLVTSDPHVSITAQLTSQNSTFSSLVPPRTEQDGSHFLTVKTAQPEMNVSRFFPSGKNDVSLNSPADQPLINRETQTPSTSFDPPRQSRLLAFGAQSRNAGQTGLHGTGQQDSSVGIGLARTPENGAFAGSSEGLDGANFSRQPLELPWATSRTTASPSFPQSFAHQGATDRPAILGQHALGSTIPNVDNFSRLQGQELPQSLHSFVQHENTAHRSNFGMEGVRDQFGIPSNIRPPVSDSRSTSISLTGNERVMGFSSPSEALHQLDGRGRNATPPAAPYGSTSPISPYDGQVQPALSVGKGSRMAKHFERISREGPSLNGIARGQMNQGLGMTGREQQGSNAPLGGGQARNIADLLTMLNNSAQSQRQPVHQNMQSQSLSGLQPLNRSQQELLLGSSGTAGRHDTFLEHDDSRFTANNLVPGLRPAHLGRSRDPANNQLYNQLDDGMQMNSNRLPLQQQQQQQQQRLLNEQLAAQLPAQQFGGGQGPSVLGRIGGNFQAPIRGGPSPISNFNPQGIPQQRLPPGLANLGGRPPHEPSQYLGGVNFGVPSQNLHGNLLPHGNSPQSFNHLQNAGLAMGAAQPQLRGGPPGLQHLPNVAGNSMNGMEFRSGPNIAQQNQLLGLGGSGLPSVLRGGPGFNNQQLPQQSIAMRQQQQQQQQLPPHVIQQMMGPQMHHIGHTGGHDTADLMALLMRGTGQE